eukprot:3067412-Pyramimonas_sp.AAC.1
MDHQPPCTRISHLALAVKAAGLEHTPGDPEGGTRRAPLEQGARRAPRRAQGTTSTAMAPPRACARRAPVKCAEREAPEKIQRELPDVPNAKRDESITRTFLQIGVASGACARAR